MTDLVLFFYGNTERQEFSEARRDKTYLLRLFFFPIGANINTVHLMILI